MPIICITFRRPVAHIDPPSQNTRQKSRSNLKTPTVQHSPLPPQLDGTCDMRRTPIHIDVLQNENIDTSDAPEWALGLHKALLNTIDRASGIKD